MKVLDWDIFSVFVVVKIELIKEGDILANKLESRVGV